MELTHWKAVKRITAFQLLFGSYELVSWILGYGTT